MRIRLPFLALLVAALLLVAGACSSDESSSGADAPADDAVAGLPEVADSDYVDMTGESEITIEAKDNNFSPQFVTVSPGTKITFDNKGRNPHNVIPVDKSQFEAIPTDEFQPGDTGVLTFDDPGDYPYYCSLHGTPSAGMDGRIRVAAE